MEEADQLRAWAIAAAAAAVAVAAASDDQLARHLEFMHATLPSRGNDVDTAKKRFAVYAALLRGHTNEALAFMARRACATLEWFPSPSQCMAILADYSPPDPPHELAMIEVRRFTDAQFPAWLDRVRAGGAVGDAPDQWKRIAVEDGAMRRLSDGSMVSRALYHGPPRQPYQAPPRAPIVVPAAAAQPTQPPRGEAGSSAALIA